jgi:8-oxo-dGTP diphosphatase
MSRVHVVGAAILRDGRCLVARRSEKMSSPLAWEFPGGKVEPGEEPRAALRRELGEELGIDVVVHDLAGTGTATKPEREIVLDVYFAEIERGEPHPHEHAEIAWLRAAELEGLEWAEPDVPIVSAVMSRLQRQ